MPALTRGPRALLAAATAIVALAGCGKQDKGGPPQMPGAMPVTVVTLAPTEVTVTRELPGRVRASLVAEVRPQVDGLVARQLFTEGSVVREGQPLYQLEDDAYRAEVARADAAVARARATRHAAELKAKRSAKMIEIAAVSQQDHEATMAALEQSRADVAAAEAALQSARVTLSRARIVAPIGGHIGRSSVTQGALVTENQGEPLALVQRLDPVHVDLTQSSAELLDLRRELAGGKLAGAGDLPVTLLLEDGTKYPHTGKLAFTDVTVDPDTGSFAIRVEAANPERLLLPGMFVRAVLGSGVRRDALLVPQQGIARDPKGGTTALVVGKDGKVEARVVQVSRPIGDRWLVEGGLVAGDRVIVAGLQKVQPGMPVTATEAGTEPAAPAAGAPAPAAH